MNCGAIGIKGGRLNTSRGQHPTARTV